MANCARAAAKVAPPAERIGMTDTFGIVCSRLQGLVEWVGLTVTKSNLQRYLEYEMPPPAELPKTGFAIEIDGRLKTEFTTKEGAEQGATELKRRFPMLQVRIYDAVAQTRHEVRV